MAQRYVEWSTPWDYGALSFEHVECISRMKIEDVVKYYRGLYAKTYEDKADDIVLEDFMNVHWAKVVEV